MQLLVSYPEEEVLIDMKGHFFVFSDLVSGLSLSVYKELTTALPLVANNSNVKPFNEEI